MAIKVNNLGSVDVDAQLNAGDYTSVVRNFPSRSPSELHTALKAWKKAEDDKADAKLAAATTAGQTALTNATTAHNAALAAKDATIAEHVQTIATLRADATAAATAHAAALAAQEASLKAACKERLDAKDQKIDELFAALGGTEAGRLILRQRRIDAKQAELDAAVAAAAAKQAELDAALAEPVVNG